MKRELTLSHSELVEAFFTLLDSEGCFREYMNCFSAERSPKASMLAYFRIVEPADWIRHAFSWSASRLGMDYWNRLNLNWISYLNSKA